LKTLLPYASAEDAGNAGAQSFIKSYTKLFWRLPIGVGMLAGFSASLVIL
jgi:hypothetical protein